MTAMFGAEARKVILNRDPPKVENEEELLAQLREKVGSYASIDRLLYHIRAARGKLHWSINSYFREVMVAPMPSGLPDFHPNMSYQAPPLYRGSRSSKSAASCILPHSVDIANAHYVQQPDAACTILRATSSLTEQATAGGAAGNDSNAAGLNESDATMPMLASSNAAGAPETALTSAGTGTKAADMETTATAGVGFSPGPAAGPEVAAAVAVEAAVAVASGCSASLDSLPQCVVEDIMSRLDATSLVCFGMASRVLHAASLRESLWQRLFQDRWGDVIFPTDPQLAMSAHTTMNGRHGIQHEHQHQHQHQGQGGHSYAPPGAPLHSDFAHMPASQLPLPTTVPGTEGDIGRIDSTQGIGMTRAFGSHTLLGSGGSGAMLQGLPSCTSPQPYTGFVAGAAIAAAATNSHVSPPMSSGLLTPSTQACSLPQVKVLASTSLATTEGAVAQAQVTGCSLQPDGSEGIAMDASRAPHGEHPLAAAASTRSYHALYRQQLQYMLTMRCTRCGRARGIVPIVYGFPSPALLVRMRERSLILGGDHLIEDCHVWGCTGCNSSFRVFPYERCAAWEEETAKAQAAAAQARQQQQQAGQGEGQHGHGTGQHCLPVYTYEL